MTDNTCWIPIPKEFDDWWDSDELSEGNPFNGDSALFWAFEGWKACEAAKTGTKTYSGTMDIVNRLNSACCGYTHVHGIPTYDALLIEAAREIVSLRAQVASLVKDIKAADNLLSEQGDKAGALTQVRMAASRAGQSYLDCIGRAATTTPNAILTGPRVGHRSNDGQD